METEAEGGLAAVGPATCMFQVIQGTSKWDILYHWDFWMAES